jgi:hypothetical protein
MLHRKTKKRIKIDFATSENTVGILGKLILVCGLSLFLYASWKNYIVTQSFNVLEQKSNAPIDVHKPHLTIEPEFEKGWAQAEGQMSTAWANLFASIERHYSSSIVFNSTQFDSRTHEVKISGNSDSLHGLIEFLEQLKKEHIFEKVDLLNHHQSKLDGHIVHSFEILAKWR